MPRLVHRHRKTITSAVLGLWMFALFVGIANACSWHAVPAVTHPSTMAVHAVGDATGDDVVPGCEEFRSDSLPLLSVLQLVQDQRAGQWLVIATHHDLGFLPISAPLLRLARSAHPPPGVPFSLRLVRLTL